VDLAHRRLAGVLVHFRDLAGGLTDDPLREIDRAVLGDEQVVTALQAVQRFIPGLVGFLRTQYVARGVSDVDHVADQDRMAGTDAGA